MSNYFVDTSALGRRYLNEIGSAWVLSWIEPKAQNVILISELAIVELQATFARWLRDGTLLAQAMQTLKTDFALHLQAEYLVVFIYTPIFQLAAALVEKYPLRTLDAIQLASALHAQQTLGEPLIFVSGDNRLLNAAANEGFVTDNPLLHP